LRSSVRRIVLVLAAGSGICFSGCYALLDDCYETEQILVNDCRAHAAWFRRDDCYRNVEHRFDFAGGFRDGYRATAEKGDHCLPLMPPRKYWKHCYQDCEGRRQIDAWYEGYAHGMLAANQDGVYENSQVPFYGLPAYGAMQRAAHNVSLEESPDRGYVPEPMPMNNLPVDEAAPAPPVTGYSVPAPEPAHAVPESIPQAERVIAPRFLPEYRDESSPRNFQPLSRPDVSLP